ncbi:hypothetical protein B0T21DRAFT_376667 [Apiosordaria backusii]|uniref:Uncharacterized protein n=1 Tax=Apiosordaria backusii TaxID=314023 RepID=A0AA40A782_9PEZI|nr:hypothetical protein B0T21DRAFT_376667 [Apiosordaria backusii]
MCTYDYTSYTGCKQGEQHFYIQWMKCSKAVETGGKYCPPELSVEVDAIRKLSGNVLSCPVHGPIAIEQHEFDFVVAKFPVEQQNQPMRRGRSRTASRRGTSVSRSNRTPKTDTFGRNFEELPQKKRRESRAVSPTESINSESSGTIPARPRTSDGLKKADRSRSQDRRRSSVAHSHRRVSSADLNLMPRRASTLRQSNGDKALDPPAEIPEHAEVQEEESRGRQPRPKTTVHIPAGNGLVGLPSSPDMNKRSPVNRAKSESRPTPTDSVTARLDTSLPQSTSLGSSDSSPEHPSEPLPFGQSGTRRPSVRRSGTRSIRKSTDEVMGRIDENVAQGEDDDQIQAGGLHITTTGIARSGTTRTSRSSRIGISPESESDFKFPPPPNRSNNSSPISRRGSETRPPVPPSPLSPVFPRYNSSYNDETSSLRSNQSKTSRRFEDQVAEGRKWAAAREQHMSFLANTANNNLSEPNLPLASQSRRESADSGYRSGQAQLPMPPNSPPSRHATPNPTQQEQKRRTLQKHNGQTPYQTDLGLPSPNTMSQRRPTPLQLGNVPPCALPVSLYSPSPLGQGQSGTSSGEVSPGNMKGKVPLFQRMGLKKKISGLWEKSGNQRAVEV